MPELTEPQIRLGTFLCLFAILAVLEFLAPRRIPKDVKARRWFTNWTIVILDAAIMRLILASAAIGVALWSSANGYGLFNLIEVPFWLAVLLSFVILDFTTWFAHLASHKIPVLWAVHRMHHSDVDFDITTAIRFHPIEIILSMLWKMLIVFLIGAPAIAVMIFEIVLNGMAMFNHTNLRLPLWLDRPLRWLVVTPDMHRVHHSIIHNETDSNYGFNLAIWDRMFKTYIDQPEKGHDGMTIGLKEWQDNRPTRVLWTLSIPFISQK